MRRFFAEIAEDKGLAYFGIALALAHILTIYAWYDTGGLTYLSVDEPWCWPFYPQCWKFRLSFTQAQLFFGSIGLLAFLSLTFFVYEKVEKGCFVLFLTWFAILILVTQDFRFRSNQFYMLSWVTVVYLFFPSKRLSLRMLILSFYFWAGSLKLNWEWISGSALYNPLWGIPVEYNVIACTYVVVLEMVLVWGLLSRSRGMFWGVFLQLVLFHVQSFSQVFYWYPLLMFLILSIFILDRFIPSPKKEWSSNRGPAVLLILFALCQCAPRILLEERGVHSLRFLALHMFESRYICTVDIVKRFRDGHTEAIPVILSLAPRMQCEPVAYWGYANNRCREWGEDPAFASLALQMKVRKSSEEKWEEIFVQECGSEKKS